MRAWTTRGLGVVSFLFILCNLYIKSISSTAARQKWAYTVDRARNEPILITDQGRETVVVMDAALAKLALQALEDARDVEEATRALERVDGGFDELCRIRVGDYLVVYRIRERQLIVTVVTVGHRRDFYWGLSN